MDNDKFSDGIPKCPAKNCPDFVDVEETEIGWLVFPGGCKKHRDPDETPILRTIPGRKPPGFDRTL